MTMFDSFEDFFTTYPTFQTSSKVALYRAGIGTRLTTLEKKEFHVKLVTIIYWLKELKAFGLDGKDFSTREHKIIIIMNEIMEIYLILQSDYYLKSDSLLQDYLNESAALLCGTIIFDIHRKLLSILP
ncbi:MAG: hypothetical protein AAFX80_19875 [Cyanobacteria bacterium J06639_18]